MINIQAWDYAIGMIKVDGLEPTKKFKEYIEKEKHGVITMEDIKQYLDKKYKVKEEQEYAGNLSKSDYMIKIVEGALTSK